MACDTPPSSSVSFLAWHCQVSSSPGGRLIAAGLEEMFREHWSLVLGYLTARVRDRHLAEELAAETYYRAARAFLGWRGEAPAAWLLAIARNVLVDAVRKAGREQPLDASMLDPVESPDEQVVVGDLLERLPEQDRRLLVLVHVYGFSCPEVAAMTGTSPGAVRTSLYRARQRARTSLDDA